MKKLFTFAALAVLSTTTYVANAQMTDRDLKVGDTIHVDGKAYYVGGNIITNSSFSEDPANNNNQINGWTVGGYNQMTTSNFDWHETGGADGGAYIQGKGNTGATGSNSIVTRWQINVNKIYYLSFWTKGRVPTNELQYFVISTTDIASTDGGQNELMGTDKKGNVHHGYTWLGKNGDDLSETTYGYINTNEDASWAKTSCFITTDQDEFKDAEFIYLQYNARWLGTATSFDKFYLAELYDYDTTTPEQVAYIYYQSVLETANALVEQLIEDGYETGAGDLDEIISENEVSESSSKEAIETATDAIKTAYDNYYGAYNGGAYTEFGQWITVLQNLVEYASNNGMTEGIDELNAVLTKYNDIAGDGYAKVDDTYAGIEEMKAARIAFYDAQTTVPAEKTYHIQYPNFLKTVNEPTYDETGAATYPNAENYKDGSVPSDGISTGWYIGQSGGDQRLNYKSNRVCWNAWSNSGTTTLSLQQDLTGLPNGYYSVSADMITQPGCITDQHVYAKSSTAEASSAVLTAQGMGDTDTWETLKSEKVMVADGNLTIGAIGSPDPNSTPADNGGTNTDYRRGWFCVTNFKLYYEGPLNADDIKTAFDAKVKSAQEMCDTMHFAADKKALQSVIDEFKVASAEEDMSAAIDTITKAQAIAAKSNAEWNGVMSNTYAAMQDSIATGTYGTKTSKIASKAIFIMTNWLNSADATYTDSQAKTTILRYYRDNYLPVVKKAEELALTTSEAKTILNTNLDSQVDEFTAITELPTQETLDEAITELNKAITVAQETEIFASGATDYTSLITNPGIVAKATGWTVNKTNGDGDGAKSGQQYDNDNTGYYIDSYNSTPGNMLLTVYQTIENIPNGTYEVKAMTRASGNKGNEGYYLYTIADNDTVNAKFKAVHVGETNVTKYFPNVLNAAGTDSIHGSSDYVSGDVYGPIWEEAMLWCEANPDAENNINISIADANGGVGRGWAYNSVQIEVKNHVITLGVTTDSTFTAGHVDTDGKACTPFTGTWASADNFTLTLVKAGDNTDWSPATGITEVTDKDEISEGVAYKVVDGAIITSAAIYNANGAKVASGTKLDAGIYIISNGKNSAKVAIK